MKVIFLLSIFVCVHSIPNYDECRPEESKCEYWLVVQEYLTMMQTVGRPMLVYANKGKLHVFDEDPNNATTKVPVETILTADGVQRLVIAINRTIPGPPLVVYQGQTVIVHVKNAMISDTLTMHWHGIRQRGTNFMDGVGYITQCPINAGQSFTYEFKAEPKGTFWYHSNVGTQRTNGIFGALIIKQKPSTGQVFPQDAIMFVGDWEHGPSEHAYWRMNHGNFEDGQRVHFTSTLDGALFSAVPWHSGLIQGKGRYTNPKTGKTTGAPYTWYEVQKDVQYRFRVIHHGAQYPLRVSIDNHNLAVVASDGFDFEPVTVESLIIHPGERFDFQLKADQSSDNYWIRAVSMEVQVQGHSVEAILHYIDADAEKEPNTSRTACGKDTKCKVFNCPFNNYPTVENSECVAMGQLKAVENEPTPEYKDDSEEHFLNFVLPFTRAGLKSVVNGKIFMFPQVSAGTQEDEISEGLNCDNANCGTNKLCACYHDLKIPYNKTIQMVWVNSGAGAHGSHPIHLHGHSFYVLKTVFADQNDATGHLIESTKLNHPDIDCGSDKYCNSPKWSNASWIGDQVPGLNLKNPVRKDTIVVPNGGYVVVRIRSDNPGKWFLRCFIEWQAADGMALTISEAMDKAPKPPRGFPLCNNFYNDEKRDPPRFTSADESCKVSPNTDFPFQLA